MKRTGLVYHPDYLKHDTGPSHPERPDRLKAIVGRLKGSSAVRDLDWITPSLDHSSEIEQWIRKTHQPSHLDRIKSWVPQTGHRYIDSDTPLSPFSYDAALLAVG